MSPIRILIADDHRLFREGLRALLTSLANFEVVGEAATGQQAIEQAMALQPDVILMDIQMPDVNGVEATRRIRQAVPQTGIIMVTMFEDDNSVFAAMRAGARGYILKDADQTEVIRTLESVASGEALFGAAIAERMMKLFSNPPPDSSPSAFPELTDREHEVLELIAQGYSNAEIAAQLYISPKTVSNHVTSIFDKLQVIDRAQAIVKARKAGFGSS